MQSGGRACAARKSAPRRSLSSLDVASGARARTPETADNAHPTSTSFVGSHCRPPPRACAPRRGSGTAQHGTGEEGGAGSLRRAPASGARAVATHPAQLAPLVRLEGPLAAVSVVGGEDDRPGPLAERSLTSGGAPASARGPNAKGRLPGGSSYGAALFRRHRQAKLGRKLLARIRRPSESSGSRRDHVDNQSIHCQPKYTRPSGSDNWASRPLEWGADLRRSPLLFRLPLPPSPI